MKQICRYGFVQSYPMAMGNFEQLSVGIFPQTLLLRAMT